jgi:hypothetical protein
MVILVRHTERYTTNALLSLSYTGEVTTGHKDAKALYASHRLSNNHHTST